MKAHLEVTDTAGKVWVGDSEEMDRREASATKRFFEDWTAMGHVIVTVGGVDISLNPANLIAARLVQDPA